MRLLTEKERKRKKAKAPSSSGHWRYFLSLESRPRVSFYFQCALDSCYHFVLGGRGESEKKGMGLAAALSPETKKKKRKKTRTRGEQGAFDPPAPARAREEDL